MNTSHEIQIAGLKLSGNLFLAPMAGYTDQPYREICAGEGADLLFTEMVSAEAVCRENDKTLRLAAAAPSSDAHAIQIFGFDPARCGEAAVRLLPFNPKVIDLNCGCPVPKVIKTGAGSALMRDPECIGEIVRSMRDKLDSSGASDVAVTVKIRSGWDKSSLNFLEAAKIARDAGAAMVSIHPRTRVQGYSGTADWSVIRELANQLNIPVCGSGDLFSAGDTARMLALTGCDAVMFARGSIGRPWLFRRSAQLLRRLGDELQSVNPEDEEAVSRLLHQIETADSEVPHPEVEEILEISWRHVELACEMLGEKAGAREMRKHLCGYTKGVPGGKAFRNALVHCATLSDYREAFQSYRRGLDFE